MYIIYFINSFYNKIISGVPQFLTWSPAATFVSIKMFYIKEEQQHKPPAKQRHIRTTGSRIPVLLPSFP